MASLDVAATEVHVAVVGDACAACGARLATDQRYCVECGQPRGAPRLPSIDSAPLRPQEARSIPSSRLPPATTLIAGIGTLLLAMGIGVYLGHLRAAPASSKAAPQVVTVVSSGPGASTGAAAPATAPAATPAKTPSPAAAAAAKQAAAKKAQPAATKAPPNAVKIGSPGKGPGYQNGHFTGDFFG